MAEARAERCVSCGAEQARDYCPECGERRLTAADRSFVAFLRQALEAVTDVDSRLFLTFRRLIFSPGYLTLAFAEGRRKPYLAPVQLFLLANLAYFLLQPLSTYTGFNTPLDSQLERQAYSSALPVAEWVAAATAQSGLDAAAFEVVFNNQSELLARTLVFFMVPLFALVLALFMLGRRRPFVDHLVFAVHFYAFDLLVVHCVVLMFWPYLVYGMAQLASAMGAPPGALRDAAMFASEVGADLLVVMPWLYFGYRRFYAIGFFRASLTALASLIALYLATLTYRLLLLLVTLATV